MNPAARAIRWVASLLPVPRSLDDTPPSADPRVDPDALDTFGRAQIAQFGVGQGHEGAAPLPTRYATDAAAEAREAERRRIND